MEHAAPAIVRSLPGAAALRALPRSARAAALRPFLDGERAALAEAHRAGEAGDASARRWSDALDQVVVALHRAALPAAPDGAALIAVGGHGRRELCPCSDLDLWFITDGAAGALAAHAEEVLYPLWDLKLQVGHAVRSIDEAVELARGDLTAATALLDARRLDGDEGCAKALAERARERLLARDPAAFVARLAEEKRARHEKFGDTVFLLEPDVKNGEGGYRDLLVALWAAKARFGARDFGDLLALGLASERQVAALIEARRFFLRVRTAAHLFAKRRQDRLLFEVQEAIAPGLAPPDLAEAIARATEETRAAAGGGQALIVRPAVAPAVEWLMQRYYLHARAVRREGDRLLDRAAETPPRKPRVRAIDASFVLWNGTLSTTGPEVFRDRPSEMVRLFRVALDAGAPIYGHTRDLIAEACAREGAAARLEADPASARELCALLIDPRDRPSESGPPLLEQMHDLGLLVQLMPEFGPCAGRVQHDLYHVFTVDQHSLYAVARLKALARGELAEALPTATSAMRTVADPLPLYLGTLLHDVGKPLGKAHSETGARLAKGIAARLRLDPRTSARIELLVLQHLLLAHLSQRRDLSDDDLIARLADDLGSEETLTQLYLLTIADMSMVSPDNLSSWKERLLSELYARTLRHFRAGRDDQPADAARAAKLAQRQLRAAQLAGATPDELAPWFAGLPERYFAQTPPRMIARHVALSRARRGKVAVELTHRRRRGWSELTVIADDAPGLLAKIAGVLVQARASVLGARIATRRALGAPAETIDVFLVRDRHGQSLDGGGPAAPARLQAELERLLDGGAPVEELVAAALKERRRALPARVVPAVKTEVEVDNQVSAEFTVVDVLTDDREGVLYTITRTLSELGLDIHLSKVATEGSRVADVFYVRCAGGGKLDPPQVAQLRESLLQALAALA